jgi:hypothetical protein
MQGLEDRLARERPPVKAFDSFVSTLSCDALGVVPKTELRPKQVQTLVQVWKQLWKWR